MPEATAASKKYKLRAVDPTADPKQLPCAFFASAKGCRSGSNCKFSHEITSEEADFSQAPPTKRVTIDDTVVSSESSDGEAGEIVPNGKRAGEKKATKTKTATMAQNSTETSDVNDSPFAPVQKSSKKRTAAESQKNPFANPPEVKAPPKPQSNAVTISAAPKQQPPPKKRKSAPSGSKSSSSAPVLLDFRSMNLPIASFTMPGTTEPESKGTEASPAKRTITTTASSITPKPDAPPSEETPSLPLPASTSSGRKWLEMVEKTRAHPRYKSLYDLSKYMEQDKNAGYSVDSLWVKTLPYEPLKEQHPQVIAIDCEMCETTDPVTQQKDHRALCRVSVVNVETDEVLLDSLVKPIWPVSNYRTWINGISAEHLDHVQFTLRHAQAFLMSLCTEETVLLGHAVHNDLAALRMHHPTVVDSAFLFTSADSETAMVSLRDLASHALKVEMPERHDSVNDARTAYQALELFRTKQGAVDSIPRSSVKANANSSSRNADYESQLFVHRIPANACDETQLAQMFLSYTHIQPIQVEDIEYSGEASCGKTHVFFASGRHGTLAFDSLEGKAIPDASGRLQKKVFLKNGNYIRIRKMAFEPSTTEGARIANNVRRASSGNP
jgi:RNA exonuclease 1